MLNANADHSGNGKVGHVESLSMLHPKEKVSWTRPRCEDACPVL
jgi:hypothetical protein